MESEGGSFLCGGTVLIGFSISMSPILSEEQKGVVEIRVDEKSGVDGLFAMRTAFAGCSGRDSNDLDAKCQARS
jgi:hypothetical protein